MFQLSSELQRQIYEFDPTYKLLFNKVLKEAIPVFRSRMALFRHIKKISYWYQQFDHLDYRGNNIWRMWLIDPNTKTHFFEEFCVLSKSIFLQDQICFLCDHLHDLIPPDLVSCYTTLSLKSIKILHQHLDPLEYKKEVMENVDVYDLCKDSEFIQIFKFYFYSREWISVSDSYYETSMWIGNLKIKEEFKIGFLSKKNLRSVKFFQLAGLTFET